MADDSPPPQTGTDPGAGDGDAGSGQTPPVSRARNTSGWPDEARDYAHRLREENKGVRQQLEEAQSKLASHADRQRSEQERREETTRAAEARAAAAELKNLRFEVAAEKGLPLKLAARLQGGTKDELEKDADSLKTEFGLDDQAGGQTPTGSGFDGGVRRPASQPRSMNALIKAAAGR